ncbi:hypothetical protein BD311DRAFT_238914 [Dichomitus squalens]|uniref:Uncharacterized protein n=1 Tax=Dichomitus squalens TaxID=114155 RepID=A0A4Q9MUV8_9APHY|nr:hypothetical protein BD311DRAFT_238914 [Dichomitus squalens]
MSYAKEPQSNGIGRTLKLKGRIGVGSRLRQTKKWNLESQGKPKKAQKSCRILMQSMNEGLLPLRL